MNKHSGVRYIYEEPAQPEPSTTINVSSLNPTALAALPRDLVERLEQATIRINLELIYNIMEEIRLINPMLSENLINLIDNFNYDRVLNLIQEAKKQK